VHPSAGAGDDDQRVALWRLGLTAPGLKLEEGKQVVLALGIPAAPVLTSLLAWDAMIADYARTGLTPGAHPLGLLREVCTARTPSTSARSRSCRMARICGSARWSSRASGRGRRRESRSC